MKIQFTSFEHLTQFIFWLDVMVGTEFFSIATFVSAVVLYSLVWLRLKWI